MTGLSRTARFLAGCRGFACFLLAFTRSGCLRDRPGSRRASRQVDLRGSRLRRRDGHRELGAARRVANPCPDRVLLRVAEPWAIPAAYCHAWWVLVHRTADGSTVNFDSPVSMVLCGPEPAIGISPSGFGDLSLYLSVGVEPVTAPARSERTVTAELTAGWRDYVDDAIAAYVRPNTVRVQRWTVDFGDGTRRTFPGDGSDRLVTTHAYEAGEFEVIVTARVVGRGVRRVLHAGWHALRGCRAVQSRHQQPGLGRVRPADRIPPAGRLAGWQPIGDASGRAGDRRRRRRTCPDLLAARPAVCALPARDRRGGGLHALGRRGHRRGDDPARQLPLPGR